MSESAFCEELNRRRQAIDVNDAASVYELSFWAHYELVTIHPWADDNSRTSRLLMNLLQMEFDVLPTKVLKEDKAEYIQALIDTREEENIDIFVDCMTELHCRHLKSDIDQFIASTTEKMADKSTLIKKMVDILVFMADKQEVTTDQIISEFNFTPTTAKRYMRQLTKFGYIEAHGGNKNRSYSIIKRNC